MELPDSDPWTARFTEYTIIFGGNITKVIEKQLCGYY